MSTAISQFEIRIAGKNTMVPGVVVQGLPVIVRGRKLRIASIMDEELVAASALQRPEVYMDAIKRNGLGADLFMFSQQIPDVEPHYPHMMEWDNLAVVPITTYNDWLENRVKYDVRKAIRKAGRLGVVVKSVPFDDVLVQGIVEIYAESPLRQGKAFWHYQKDFKTVKEESGTYLDRSEFIGAYVGEELIGFIKVAHMGKISGTIHVIAKKSHFDKKATSALLAKAVEICEQRGSTHLSYGKFIYDDPASALTEFKSRHGFELIRFPRYYVPMSLKGRIALKLGLHRGLKAAIPAGLRQKLVKLRNWKDKKRLGQVESAPKKDDQSGKD